MNTEVKKQLIILKEDYELLKDYIHNKKALAQIERANAPWILEALEEAQVVGAEDFPADAVRLNSQVTLREKQARYNYVYTVVLPDEADHRKGKVSVLSPIGAAMYGQRKGEDVVWSTAANRRMYTIMSVVQLYG